MRALRSLGAVALIACRAKAAALGVEAHGTLVPGGAHIVVQTQAGAQVSIAGLPQVATADASGRATFEVPPANVDKVLDAEVTAKLDDRIATGALQFPSGIYATGATFRCLGGTSCKGSVTGTAVDVSAPRGAVIRIAGDEHTQQAARDRYELDPVAVADRVGLTALVGIKSVVAPVELALPKGPTLHGSLPLEADVLAERLAKRLADVMTAPLARRDKTVTGGVLVMTPDAPDGAYAVRSIGGVERPRAAKVVILAHTVRGRQACGKARDPKTRKPVVLGFDLIDLAMTAYDPATGNVRDSALVKASRRCPPRNRPIASASYDEHTADKAADQLTDPPPRPRGRWGL